MTLASRILFFGTKINSKAAETNKEDISIIVSASIFILHGKVKFEQTETLYKD